MKILIALPRFPYPTLKGDQLRAFYQLRELSRRNEVHLVCLSEDPNVGQWLEKVKPFCQTLRVLPLSRPQIGWNLLKSAADNLPFQAHYFESPAARQAIEQLVSDHKIDLVYTQLLRMTVNLPHALPCPVVVDLMDAFSAGMERRAALTSFPLKTIFKAEAARLRRYEERLADRFPALTVISEADKKVFSPQAQKKIAVVPNGVDARFFEVSPIEKPDIDLIYTGNMGYYPNIQAAQYLAQEVLPLLAPRFPHLKLYLVGAFPSREILALAGKNVVVTGQVPAIEPFLSRARVFAAPLFSGSGLQNKLLEAMAAGLPVVSSPLPNAALGAAPDKEILLAENAEQFAQKIAWAFQNPTEAADIGRNARSFIRQNYDWQAFNQTLENLFKNALNSRSR